MLVARSVAEAHLYLDLRGADRAGRTVRLEARGNDLVSVYEADCGGVRKRFEFSIPVPETADGTYGAAEPSTILGPGELLSWSDHVARTVPPDARGLSAADRAESRKRLLVAADCAKEAAKFIPTGAEAVPVDAFRSEYDRAVLAAEPGRFTRARLVAIAASYMRMADGF